jgi:hypothetical protein
MNFKIIALIILVALSIILFIFTSYIELQEGVSSLVGVSNVTNVLTKTASVATSAISEGISNTMKTIDQIV